MKKQFHFTFFILTLFVLFPSVTHAEYIESLTSDITLSKDGTAIISEKFAYVFTEARHGIYRCIPTLHQDKSSSFFKERYIDIVLKSVSMDTLDVPYVVDARGNEFCIKIGDPNATITGPHLYTIEYSVGGALSYQEFGGADWYWNVSGNEWTVPIRSIKARVSSPDSILLRERACYRGAVGKTDSCQITTDEQGVIHFSGTQFDPGEGLTVAQALDRSKIPFDVRERYSVALLWTVFLLLGVGIFAFALYRYKTKFQTGNAIIPQYEPYAGVKPMYVGLLFDKRLDPRDITAGIVYLAQHGVLKIKKIEKKVLFFFEVDDYEITFLSKQAADAVEIGEFEKRLLKLLFKYQMTEGTITTLSDLQSQGNQRENYKIIQKLKSDLHKDLQEQGFYTRFSMELSVGKFLYWMYVVCFASIFVLGVIFQIDLRISILVPIAILVIVLFSMGRRTRKGYEALDHLKGFKDFLRVTETQRYIFHNAPEKNAEQFMEFLPYAIAFGVEKEWAKTFEGITIPNPGWYDGGGGMNTFNAIGLTQSLGGFSTAFAATSASGSASSGGGSSGGGSGGGGGGSW